MLPKTVGDITTINGINPTNQRMIPNHEKFLPSTNLTDAKEQTE